MQVQRFSFLSVYYGASGMTVQNESPGILILDKHESILFRNYPLSNM